MVVILDSMVDSNMEVISSMVVNNTVANSIMDNSRARTMRLSRWPRRACPGCSRSLGAVRSCKGLVGLLLCKSQRVTWRAVEACRTYLIPADWMKG